MPEPSLGILSQGNAIVKVKTTVNKLFRSGKHEAISAGLSLRNGVPQSLTARINGPGYPL